METDHKTIGDFGEQLTTYDDADVFSDRCHWV
jgi:hypothetical protein